MNSVGGIGWNRLLAVGEFFAGRIHFAAVSAPGHRAGSDYSALKGRNFFNEADPAKPMSACCVSGPASFGRVVVAFQNDFDRESNEYFRTY